MTALRLWTQDLLVNYSKHTVAYISYSLAHCPKNKIKWKIQLAEQFFYWFKKI